jgi:hypothetical protein
MEPCRRTEPALSVVRCTALILMEAPSSADHHGLLAWGHPAKEAEETSCEAPPSRTRFLGASISTPDACRSAAGIRRVRAVSPGLCRRHPHHVCRPWPPTGRLSSSASPAASPGTGRAALCARQGRPCVLGHALSRKALHGGKAQTATIAAQKMAVGRRGGMRPQASGDPAARRAPRARRRRLPWLHTRAALLAPGPKPQRQDHRPASGPQLADRATRRGVAERLPEPAVHQSRAAARARLDPDDSLRRAGELGRRKPVKPHDGSTLSLRRPLPGSGERLRVVLLADSPALQRCPRGQACVSSGRFGTWARGAAGQRDGPSGTERGHAARKGAFAEAAGRFWRATPAGQHWLARGEETPGPGQAFTLLAPT